MPSAYIDYLRRRSGALPISIVDLGGGWFSRASRGVAKKFGSDVDVTNIDVLLHGEVNDTDNFHARLGDISNLDLSDASVDLAYSWQVLFRMEEGRRMNTFREVARVLRPGGVAFVDEDYLCTLPSDSSELQDLAQELGVTLHFKNGTAMKSDRVYPHGPTTSRFLLMVKEPEDAEMLAIEEKID